MDQSRVVGQATGHPYFLIPNHCPKVIATKTKTTSTRPNTVSVFGFLACDEPKINGNFGFKDQWLALQWAQENIETFGGNCPLSVVEYMALDAEQVTRQMYSCLDYQAVSGEDKK
ncbi:hypothetical protein JVT61DRAFT_13197 [Boletus reticuloceps]|uniref:Carboxylesterase type B domain-containing protein n=1 Tax=Boletus reticuloceps TaxID=495285 RepID=A0A8I2YXT9_9AGAM|nr:hypothetical protein JVT61DRAFT_13197 [Boletus reticuloceps]